MIESMIESDKKAFVLWWILKKKLNKKTAKNFDFSHSTYWTSCHIDLKEPVRILM